MPIYYIYIKNDLIHLRKSANPISEGEITEDEKKKVEDSPMTMYIIKGSDILEKIGKELQTHAGVKKAVTLDDQIGYTFSPKEDKNIYELLSEMQKTIKGFQPQTQQKTTVIIPTSSIEKKDTSTIASAEKRKKKIEVPVHDRKKSITSSLFSPAPEKTLMMPEQHTEFSLFMRSQLEKSQNANYILIGEDHENSSALIAIANCINEIKSSHRQVLVFSESLKSLYKGGKVMSYTLEDVEENIVTSNEEENLAVRLLIYSGIKLYGLENRATLPFDSWEAYPKEKIYEEYKKIENIITVGVSPEVKERAKRGFEDKATDTESLLLLLNGIYSASNTRITIPNQEFTSQIIYISKQFKKPLSIFSGGAAHIPRVETFSKTLIDKGMLVRFSEMGLETAACFVNDHPVPDGEPGYTPRDSSAICSPILKRFQIKSEVTDKKPLLFYKLIQEDTEKNNLALLGSTIVELTSSVEKSYSPKETQQLLLLKELRNNYELAKSEYKHSTAKVKKAPSLREIAIVIKKKNKRTLGGVALDLLNKIIYPNYLLSSNQAIVSPSFYPRSDEEDKERTYIGMLDEKEIEFKIKRIDGDNTDCGFNALKVTRSEFVHVLLSKKVSLKNKESLSEEIDEFLREKNSIEFLEGHLLPEHLRVLYKARLFQNMMDNTQGELDKKKQAVQAILASLKTNKLKEEKISYEDPVQRLCSQLESMKPHGYEKLIDELEALSKTAIQAEKNYKEFLLTGNVYKAYISAYAIDAPGYKLMLGYNAAKLYAKYRPGQPICLYLWKKKEGENNRLECINPPQNKEGEIIHMLHTRQGTHYDVLVPQVPVAELKKVSGKRNNDDEDDDKKRDKHERKTDITTTTATTTTSTDTTSATLTSTTPTTSVTTTKFTTSPSVIPPLTTLESFKPPANDPQILQNTVRLSSFSSSFVSTIRATNESKVTLMLLSFDTVDDYYKMAKRLKESEKNEKLIELREAHFNIITNIQGNGLNITYRKLSEKQKCELIQRLCNVLSSNLDKTGEWDKLVNDERDAFISSFKLSGV